MKRLTATLIIICALVNSNNAFADGSVQTQIEIKGRVDTICAVVNLDNTAFDFGELANTSGQLQSDNTLSSRVLGKVTCNAPVSLSIKSTNGAMKTGSGACETSGSTTNCVFYHAKAEWDGIEAELNANGTPVVSASIAPSAIATSADLIVGVDLTGPLSKTLLTGSYSDLLVVKVGALF